jgi:hypothetical protein
MKRPRTCRNVETIDGQIRRCQAQAVTEREVERNGRRYTIPLCGGCAFAHDMDAKEREANAPRLAWSDAATCAAWLAGVRSEIEDLHALADDATRMPRRRMFSRHEARRRIAEAKAGLDGALAYAARGLPGTVAPEPRPAAP